jgi:hypothetical protein
MNGRGTHCAPCLTVEHEQQAQLSMALAGQWPIYDQQSPILEPYFVV